MKVVPVIVAGSIASLKVAAMGVLTGTTVARFAGTVDKTEGGGAVVNVHTKLAASQTPAGSRAPVVIVAVYVVLAARSTSGVKVAVEPAKVTTCGLDIVSGARCAPFAWRGTPAPRVTTPGTSTPPGPARVNVAALIVTGFIGSLKEAVTTALTRTPVAKFAGTVDITVGGPVVNVHTKFAWGGLPPGLVAPVVMVAVYRVRAASDAVGVKVAVEPE